MSNLPLVSIVIPVYNGSNFLDEAIYSALAQTYSNIEVLVINDGSNDDGATRNIALRYGDKIRYFEKENGGVATALNLGIKEMKGEYFSWLSHDDKYLPNKVSCQVDFLLNLSNKIVVLYADIEFIDKDSNIISQYKFHHYPPECFRPAFIRESIISGCTLLVPKVCFELCGDFDPALKTTQDYDLWFKISEKFKFIHISEVLIQSRLHDKQDSNKLQNIALVERDSLYYHFIENISETEIKLLSKGDIASYYISLAFKMTICRCLKAGRLAISKARNNLFKSTFLRNCQNIFKLILLFLLIWVSKLYIWILGYNSLIKLKKSIRIFRFKMKN
ncbi:MAG TPA: glycosyltransferase [Bacteroidales bacterium]|nr:glycosyltransferase [Bacteroidales bacterium]